MAGRGRCVLRNRPHRGRSFAVVEAETVDKALDMIASERFDCVLYENGAKGWSELRDVMQARSEPVAHISEGEPMAELIERVRTLVARNKGPRKGAPFGPINKELIEAKEAA